jgi:hypothetical protein
MIKDKAMRNKVAKHLRDLRSVKTDYLTVREKNRVIRSYTKGYIETLETLRTLAKAK